MEIDRKIERAEPSRGAPDAAGRIKLLCLRAAGAGNWDIDDAIIRELEAFCASGHVVLLEALRRCVAVMNEVELHEGKKFFTYTKREAEAAIQQAEGL